MLRGCRGQVTPRDEHTSVLRRHICEMKESLSLWWCHACVTVSRCVMHSVMWWWIGHLFVLFDSKGQQCCTCVTLDHCDESEKRVWMDDFSFYQHSHHFPPSPRVGGECGHWPGWSKVTCLNLVNLRVETAGAGDGITCCLGARYWTRRQVCGDNWVLMLAQSPVSIDVWRSTSVRGVSV